MGVTAAKSSKAMLAQGQQLRRVRADDKPAATSRRCSLGLDDKRFVSHRSRGGGTKEPSSWPCNKCLLKHLVKHSIAVLALSLGGFSFPAQGMSGSLELAAKAPAFGGICPMMDEHHRHQLRNKAPRLKCFLELCPG